MGLVVGAINVLFAGGKTMVGMAGVAIMNTPILLLFVVLPLVGLGVGLFRRLLGK